MRTSQLKKILVCALLFKALAASGLETSDQSKKPVTQVECLMQIMAVTENAVIKNRPKGLERPFILNKNFVVFPFVLEGRLAGFYLYHENSAWFYDQARSRSGKVSLISQLNYSPKQGIFDLISQPYGLETLTISYLPGFSRNPAAGQSASVMLGATILPLVGAFLTPAQSPLNKLYENPSGAPHQSIEGWMVARNEMAKTKRKVTINRTILKLETKAPPEDLLAPLRQEMKLRRTWIQTHNLDEESFNKFSRLLSSPCADLR